MNFNGNTTTKESIAIKWDPAVFPMETECDNTTLQMYAIAVCSVAINICSTTSDIQQLIPKDFWMHSMDL